MRGKCCYWLIISKSMLLRVCFVHVYTEPMYEPFEVSNANSPCSFL